MMTAYGRFLLHQWMIMSMIESLSLAQSHRLKRALHWLVGLLVFNDTFSTKGYIVSWTYETYIV